MTLINGVASESITANDRGLQYGDGVFRTLRVQAGQALCWPRHYRKLAADCGAIGIACPESNLLASELAALAAGLADGVAKIIVTRGASGRGYAAAANLAPTRIVSLSPLPEYPASYRSDGVKVHVCNLRLGFQPCLAGIKHLNRLENVLARREWNDGEIAEGLLRDSEGNVVEGIASNLFLVENGVLLTPDLSRCGVAGVQRERLLERAAAENLAWRSEHISLARLLQADEAWLVNSVIGAWPIRELAGKRWTPGKWSATVQRWLGEGA